MKICEYMIAQVFSRLHTHEQAFQFFSKEGRELGPNESISNHPTYLEWAYRGFRVCICRHDLHMIAAKEKPFVSYYIRHHHTKFGWDFVAALPSHT